jgi:hypothetical protein
MLNFSNDIEALIREKAAGTGRAPDKVLRLALAHAGDVPPWRGSDTPPPAHLPRMS